MRINNNVAAFNAYRNLSTTQGQLGKSLEKLSSGFRINRAADDAAGLVKSEGLRAEIKGTQQAVKNAQDGVSLVQTAEGALNEVHSILQRMRELAVSANNTATSDGVAEQAEITELLDELDAIGTRTEFAGQTVFDGAARQFQVGANSADTLEVTINNLSSAAVGANGTDVSGVDVSADAGAAIDCSTRHRQRLIPAFDPRCVAEPARAHHLEPAGGGREPVGVRVADP
jgi:flagellin